MKLLYCRKCGDTFNLSLSRKSCSCGEVSGQYTDNLRAVYSGNAIPFCFSNGSFADSAKKQEINDAALPDKFYGERFEAWICPANSETFKKEGAVDD